MKSKSLKIAIVFGAFFVSLFILANTSLAFDDLTTHPAITDEVVDFYNLFSDHKITPEEKEAIISGAMEEDIPPRWINHFYDPIRNIGWTGRNTGIWPTSLVRYFSGTVLSSAYPVSSLNWLHNQDLQTYYKMYKGNRTWERAVYEYANGNPKEALYTLGYILHLIEDAAVPDHTRDDPHAHDMRLATGDYGSPLEEYAKRYNRNNFNIADNLKNNGYKPIVLNSIDEHLISLAKYSNGYFFSKDTINDPIYQNPKIIEEDGKFGYGLDKNGERFKLVQITKVKIDKYNTKTLYSILEEKEKKL